MIPRTFSRRVSRGVTASLLLIIGVTLAPRNCRGGLQDLPGTLRALRGPVARVEFDDTILFNTYWDPANIQRENLASVSFDRTGVPTGWTTRFLGNTGVKFWRDACRRIVRLRLVTVLELGSRNRFGELIESGQGTKTTTTASSIRYAPDGDSAWIETTNREVERDMSGHRTENVELLSARIHAAPDGSRLDILRRYPDTDYMITSEHEGNRISEVHATPDTTRVLSRSSRTLDSTGAVIEECYYSRGRTQLTSYINDSLGNPVVVRYDWLDAPWPPRITHISYRYDHYGNWIERTEHSTGFQMSRHGIVHVESAYRNRRSITYYEPRSAPDYAQAAHEPLLAAVLNELYFFP